MNINKLLLNHNPNRRNFEFSERQCTIKLVSKLENARVDEQGSLSKAEDQR